MLTPDIVNATFEFFGAFFILNHCRTLLKDKRVAGLSILSVVFFTTWGVWNMFYYPHLDQWWSFWGGLAICLSNFYYVALLVYYKKYPGGKV